MDLSTLVQILNNGIPAGIASEMIVRLIDKAKAMFNGKAITKEKIEQLMTEKIELKETLTKLQDELTKANIINVINNADKIEIGKQFNNSTFYNTTFN
jgi:hypothetical protein